VTRRTLVAGGGPAALMLVVVPRCFVWIDPGARRVIGLHPSLVGYDDTIALRRAPEGGGGPALVRERAEALKRLAGDSQSFWMERVR
jgi:hypothetical protein